MPHLGAGATILARIMDIYRSGIPILLCAPLLYAQNASVTVTIDVNASRRPINQNIYGVAYGTAQTLPDLNIPMNRYGGNNTSRYNWQVNGDNRGFDWYFESIPEPNATAGERGDSFIQVSKSAGAEPMITIPIIDWVAKLGANRGKLASYSIAKYGAQTGNDWQWFPDAGNGIRKSDGAEMTWNDKTDANTPNSSALQSGWVQHMVTKWGSAAAGGLKYYILDNEHSIWHSTHRDVHPVGATMSEIRDKMLDYAGAIKAQDPAALVVGPEEWGWSGYFYSGYDQQWGSKNGWNNLPDRAANGGWDYLPWLLKELKLQTVAGGLKPLDVFSAHFYPQGGEFSNDVSTTMQLRRNRSTRALWDPNYVDETWIGAAVKLIPRLRGWADTYYYPGTPIAITEYNWGAESHINGATAQADILGIFGREGLDIGARWTTPDASTPTYKAMKLYRNYDGLKSTFGDTSVKTAVPNPDNVAAFGAHRGADGALTVMVISKYLSGNTPVTLNVSNFSGSGIAQVWQLTAANTITRLTDVAYTGSIVPLTVPPQSITLMVMPSGAANQAPVASATATPTSGYAPLTVGFDGTASSDPDGTIASFAWTFGDSASASGATVSHTYQNSGTYTAALTVTDNRGATNSKTLVITVLQDPNFIAAPASLTGSAKGGLATLRWTDKSSNETGFSVERAPNGGSFAQAGSVGAGVTTYTERPARGTYQYRVRAFNTTAFSGYSNTVTVRVK